MTEHTSVNLALSLPSDLADWIESTVERTGRTPAAVVEQALRQTALNEETRNAVYLSAPVNALVEGLYRENTPVGEIKRHGDFGLGTFNDLDGEMVVLDGKVYQLKADGNAYDVDDAVETPFACVTFFSPDTTDEAQGRYDFDGLNHILEQCIPSPNMLYAIRVDAAFDHVRTRSVPKQENYRPLAEVAREQPTFDYHDVDGTLMGFYTPAFMSSLNVPGYHLHLLTADRRHGGHLLGCQMTRAKIGIQHVPRLELALPMTLDYLTADLTRDTRDDLKAAEHEQEES